MNGYRFLVYLGIMAVSTYLIRAVPFSLINKELKSNFLKSFFEYIPYAVLGAMTFPAILYSTTYIVSAVIGLASAVVMAYYYKGLVKVAVAACLSVFLCETIIKTVL